MLQSKMGTDGQSILFKGNSLADLKSIYALSVIE